LFVVRTIAQDYQQPQSQETHIMKKTFQLPNSSKPIWTNSQPEDIENSISINDQLQARTPPKENTLHYKTFGTLLVIQSLDKIFYLSQLDVKLKG
jgi:hypothetical protein